MATPSASTVGLDSRAQLLVSTAARLNRLHNKILAGLDVPLTFRQYRTLSRVLGGSTTLSQLAAHANLTMPTVSEGVDVLVRRGLLGTRQSSVDRRAITVHVTKAGAAAAAAGDRALHEVTETLMSDLTEQERERFGASLQVVYDSATKYFQEVLNVGS